MVFNNQNNKAYLKWKDEIYNNTEAIKPSDSKHDLDIKTTEKRKLEGLGIFQKIRFKNLKGAVRSDLTKTRLLHLGNLEKPPHPQLSAQRACEG